MKHRTTATRTALAVLPQTFWQHQIHTPAGSTIWQGNVDALWARKRNGILTVYLGGLRGFQAQQAATVTEWMDRYTNAAELLIQDRYNGTKFRHRGRGSSQTQDLLAEFHASDGRELPKGFAGWWTSKQREPAGGYLHIASTDDPQKLRCGAWTPFSSGIVTGTEGKTPCPTCAAASE